MAPDDPVALHRSLFTIDTHVDTPTARLLRDNWDFGQRHDRAADQSQCDLPRMEGAVDALGFAVYSSQCARRDDAYAVSMDRVRRVLDRVDAVAAAHAGRCAVAKSAADLRRLKREGRHGLLLTIENAYPLGRDAGNVARLQARGVRMLGLTHMMNNDVADSSTDPRGPEWGGLSPLGREMVAECNRLGLVLDASHASDDALRGLFAHSRAPVVLSHSGCRAVCDHPRNIGDQLLRELAAHGGVIQMNALAFAMVPDAVAEARARVYGEMGLRAAALAPTPEALADLGARWDRIDAEYPSPRATIGDFVRHLEHAVEVAGVDHVGIGCDFDGGGGVEGLDHVGDYPNLTRMLLARGFSPDDLAKVWGGNLLRVLEAAERASA